MIPGKEGTLTVTLCNWGANKRSKLLSGIPPDQVQWHGQARERRMSIGWGVNVKHWMCKRMSCRYKYTADGNTTGSERASLSPLGVTGAQNETFAVHIWIGKESRVRPCCFADTVEVIGKQRCRIECTISEGISRT